MIKFTILSWGYRAFREFNECRKVKIEGEQKLELDVFFKSFKGFIGTSIGGGP